MMEKMNDRLSQWLPPLGKFMLRENCSVLPANRKEQPSSVSGSESRFRFTGLLSVFVILLITSCQTISEEDLDDEDSDATVSDQISANSQIHEEASDYVWSESEIIPVILNETSISVTAAGASASGSKLTITSAGTYKLTGTLTNGQVVINTNEKTPVRLILDNASITCSAGAPIYVVSAVKVIIVLADNSINKVTDGATYVLASGSDEPNAAIFSTSNLSFCGNGTLTVTGKYNDGIASKDGLIIKSGNFNITSADDGIRGKDYLVIRSGNFTINASGDGIISDNADNKTKGFISIDSGTFSITSGGDGMAAETDVLIADGTFLLVSGGGSSGKTSQSVSSKGIKGLVAVTIDKGTFSISSADDAIHSNSKVIINSGSFTLSTGDDGIHSDESLTLNGGDVTISKAYEGLESRNIFIKGSIISIRTSDDGINGAGGSMLSTQYGPASSGNLTIDGGYIYINADGDGLDINGAISMTGGSLIVNGPTNSANGAIDYDSSFKMTGGYLLAAGSAGMAMTTSSSSSQCALLINFTSALQAGTLVRIQTSAGDEIMTFNPVKTYQSVAFSSSKLTKGISYDVYTGGSYSGSVKDGLYTGGNYTAGNKYTTFTITGITTTIGSTGGMGGGGFPGGRP